MSESEGYTPSTEEVCNNMALGVCFAMMFPPEAQDINWPAPRAREVAKAVFDRWLLAERARIWDECDAAIVAHVERNGTSVEGWPSNPYRKGGDA